PDMSALADAKARAAQSAAGIHTAAQAPLDKPVKAASPDLSAFAAARGKAAADGAAVDNGLASGIAANAGAAVAAAESVANSVAAVMAKALETNSPSKKTEKIGKDFDSGFVVGLEGGQAAINAAATAIGKNAAKAADITSIDSTVTKMLTQVPKGDTGITRWLKADEAKLTSLANQRQKLETEITDATQIAQQAISSASVLNAASYTPALSASSGPQAASETISGMQAMLADQQQFTKVIGQLGKQGLNATELSQL